jgi:hypothetical protein
MDQDNGERITPGIALRAVGERYCYYVHESSAARRDDGTVGYQVAVVTDGEPGYRPDSTIYESVELAQRRANHFNAIRGITPDDVLDIVASSKRAGA